MLQDVRNRHLFQGIDFPDDDQQEQIRKTAGEAVPDSRESAPRSQLGTAHGHTATKMAPHVRGGHHTEPCAAPGDHEIGKAVV